MTMPLKFEIKNAIDIALELEYPKSTINSLKKAKDVLEITEILRKARLSLPDECVSDYTEVVYKNVNKN